MTGIRVTGQSSITSTRRASPNYESADFFLVMNTEVQSWQDAVLRWRLLQPATTSKQQELDRIIRLVGLLSDIRNPDRRRRWLKGFVRSVLAPKKAGQKRAERDETYIRRDCKIFWALEEIREKQRVSLDEAKQKLRKEPRQYGFGPEDGLPGFDGIEEADKRARKWLGMVRIPVPRRQKKAARGRR